MVATRPKIPSKMMRWIPDDPIGSDWLSIGSCNSALTVQALKMSKIKKLKRSNFGQSMFLGRKMRSAAKRSEQSMGYWYLKMEWFCELLSPSPTRLSLVRVNPSIPGPTQSWCLKSTSPGKWKSRSRIMDGVCWIMISNQHTDVMWQNRHISPQQNHALMKILSKKCRALGLHP